MPTFIHGKNTGVYLDEFDMTSYFTDSSFSIDNDTAETTAYGDTNKSYLLGIRGGTLSLSGPLLLPSSSQPPLLNLRTYMVSWQSRSLRIWGIALCAALTVALIGGGLWSYPELLRVESVTFMGSKFGKKKIFPKVSPNKTWLGALSGYLFTLLFLYLFVLLNEAYNFNIPLLLSDIILLSFIFGVISQFGDYIESYIKRKFNVKDSGKILQGHGGMLDRLDSLILVAPFFVLYLMFIEGFVIL